MRKAQNLRRQAGFTLIEMIVVSLLLMIAMLGLLAVFDASARINKNETDVADAQGAVRYGIYQMTRTIRMAGAGGLYITQAVLNHNDFALPGIAPSGTSFDNTAGVSITDVNGVAWLVRPGTDMIEVRGVINSPLIGFDQEAVNACAPCTGSESVTVLPIIGNAIIGQHVNNDASLRPQFGAVDAYTAGTTAAQPRFVIVEDGNADLHSGCSDPTPGGVTRYPQPVYNVGVITAQTALIGSSSFGTVDFGNSRAQRFNVELPSETISQPATVIQKVRRAGVMDDIVFFIGLDPVAVDPLGQHPFLGQATRRGDVFLVERLAEDVEDMQVAYGLDTNGDNAVTRLPGGGCAASTDDPDPNFSTIAGCDEWFPNVASEAAIDDAQFQLQDPFTPGHTGAPLATHCPTLHGVMISLLAKAKDSDPTYKGPAAQGYLLMNSTAAPITPGTYRRRPQTLKVNLRNFAFQG